MAKLTDDAGETFENVPSRLSDAGNHDNYDGRRLRTSKACPDLDGYFNLTLHGGCLTLFSQLGHVWYEDVEERTQSGVHFYPTAPTTTTPYYYYYYSLLLLPFLHSCLLFTTLVVLLISTASLIQRFYLKYPKPKPTKSCVFDRSIECPVLPECVQPAQILGATHFYKRFCLHIISSGWLRRSSPHRTHQMSTKPCSSLVQKEGLNIL
ncbi:unnamed protein product [Protopolystoma xenopodis]|uniref:Uncharacterized protein n=1 Tax=Protopolystoma xenopodis TaxID=117903 RepID=A0A3S5A1M3_9PLAT|nr:unnamed protein product [Protopolystoma xenopodis]